MPDGIQKWASGEPRGEACVALGYGGIGRWDDVSCKESNNPWLFCRRTVGYKLAINGVYYKLLYSRPKSHQEALQMCKADGAQLANAPYGQLDRDAFGQFAALLWGLFGRSVLDGIIVDGTDNEIDGLWKIPNGTYKAFNQDEDNNKLHKLLCIKLKTTVKSLHNVYFYLQPYPLHNVNWIEECTSLPVIIA